MIENLSASLSGLFGRNVGVLSITLKPDGVSAKIMVDYKNPPYIFIKEEEVPMNFADLLIWLWVELKGVLGE